MKAVERLRRPPPAGVAPLAPRVKWKAILLGTLILVPAYWSVLAGAVSVASDEGGGPVPGPLIAFGLCLVPFLYIALAVVSQHPQAPGAVLKAMGLTLLVGVPVAALAADAVTGMVAGIGAGGIAAIRADLLRAWRVRALAVAAASAFVFIAVRTAPEAAILVAPCLPLTAVGVADHLSERRQRA
jgi:hypothetical protein